MHLIQLVGCYEFNYLLCDLGPNKALILQTGRVLVHVPRVVLCGSVTLTWITWTPARCPTLRWVSCDRVKHAEKQPNLLSKQIQGRQTET